MSHHSSRWFRNHCIHIAHCCIRIAHCCIHIAQEVECNVNVSFQVGVDASMGPSFLKCEPFGGKPDSQIPINVH